MLAQLHVKSWFVKSYQSESPQTDARSALKQRTPVFPLNGGKLSPLYDAVSPLRFVWGLKVKPSDIIISTFPKCGTTFTQQIVHQIRTRGAAVPADDAKFDLASAIPFLLPFSGVDRKVQKNYHPKAYKTHMNYEAVKHLAGKHIYIIRNPYDVMWSLFQFIPNAVNVDHEMVGLDHFYFDYYKKTFEFSSYEANLMSWWERRNDTNVLFLFYEDMIEDLPATVKKIAKFMNVSLTKVELDRVAEHSTHSYMCDKVHKHKLDGTAEMNMLRHFSAPHHEPRLTLTSKVRGNGGCKGQGRGNLTASVKKDLDDVWTKVVRGRTGFESYDEMRRAGI